MINLTLQIPITWWKQTWILLLSVCTVKIELEHYNGLLPVRHITSNLVQMYIYQNLCRNYLIQFGEISVLCVFRFVRACMQARENMHVCAEHSVFRKWLSPIFFSRHETYSFHQRNYFLSQSADHVVLSTLVCEHFLPLTLSLFLMDFAFWYCCVFSAAAFPFGSCILYNHRCGWYRELKKKKNDMQHGWCCWQHSLLWCWRQTKTHPRVDHLFPYLLQ